MRIVDDKLALDLLAGRLPSDDDGPTATTWGFHYRLARAVSDARTGALSADLTHAERRAVLDPPRHLLVVLDPRVFTTAAAEVAVHHGLNVLAAELVAAAKHHRATIVLSAPNVGRRWRKIFRAEEVPLQVI